MTGNGQQPDQQPEESNQSSEQASAFAARIDPRKFNFSGKMAAIVGAIIGHDYGVRDRKGGTLTSLAITSDGFVVASSTASDGGGAFIGEASNLDRNLADFRSELTPADRDAFDSLYASRVTDFRTAN